MARRIHAREQIPFFQCATCQHLLIEVHYKLGERWTGPDGAERLPLDAWKLIHADDVEATDCCGECEPAEIDHGLHRCLACSEPIYRDEPETGIKIRPYGVRYRHLSDAQCRAAMSRNFGSRVVSGGLAGL
jgi:hypothetical protein